mgnify:CR=1 FL=1
MSLKIKNLRKVYTLSFNKKIEDLKKLDLNIKDGEIYALIGQNGAGKTTAIKCILNLVKKTGGEVSYNNMSIYSLMEKRKVGYMPEILGFPDKISFKKLMLEIGALRKLSDADIIKKINILSEMFRIHEKIDLPLSSYSKGMRKKVNFIQSIIHDPELLILDEPTDGLDPVSRRIMLNHIKDIADKGCTIVITSHILADLENICNRAGIIHDGSLLNEICTQEYFKINTSYKIDIDFSGRGEINRITADNINFNIDIRQYDSMKISGIEYKTKNLEEWYFDTLRKAGDNYVSNCKIKDN